jgi:hypothetical protein
MADCMGSDPEQAEKLERLGFEPIHEVFTKRDAVIGRLGRRGLRVNTYHGLYIVTDIGAPRRSGINVLMEDGGWQQEDWVMARWEQEDQAVGLYTHKGWLHDADKVYVLQVAHDRSWWIKISREPVASLDIGDIYNLGKEAHLLKFYMDYTGGSLREALEAAGSAPVVGAPSATGAAGSESDFERNLRTVGRALIALDPVQGAAAFAEVVQILTSIKGKGKGEGGP